MMMAESAESRLASKSARVAPAFRLHVANGLFPLWRTRCIVRYLEQYPALRVRHIDISRGGTDDNEDKGTGDRRRCGRRIDALSSGERKAGTDAVLIERKELTSGSTWHAAGLLPLFNMSYSVGQLHKYSVDLYSALEEETGLNVGFSKVSNIRLAMTKDQDG